MSQQIMNMVAKAALKDTAKKNINSKNPYFEDVPVQDKHGRPTGKVRKQKKGVPLGVSQHDAQILKKVRRRAYRLDMSLFNCCGIRFGWGSVVGIVPVIGDLLDLLLAWNVVRTCEQIEGGLPTLIQSRMYFNIALDFGIGLVPFLGDIADAIYRANTRNAWVLEEYLVKKAQAEAQLRQNRNHGNGNGTGNSNGNGNDRSNPLPSKPKPSLTSPFSGRSGFFGSKTRQPDEEMAGIGSPATTINASRAGPHGRSEQESGVMSV